MNYFWLLIAAWVGFMLGLVTCALLVGPEALEKTIDDLERGAL